MCSKGGQNLPRDGTKNLKPMNQRTKEEQKKIATKAGKASGVARRKKADLKKAMELLLSLDVQDKKLKKTLEEHLQHFSKRLREIKKRQRTSSSLQIQKTSMISKSKKNASDHSNWIIKSVRKSTRLIVSQ